MTNVLGFSIVTDKYCPPSGIRANAEPCNASIESNMKNAQCNMRTGLTGCPSGYLGLTAAGPVVGRETKLAAVGPPVESETGAGADITTYAISDKGNDCDINGDDVNIKLTTRS